MTKNIRPHVGYVTKESKSKQISKANMPNIRSVNGNKSTSDYKGLTQLSSAYFVFDLDSLVTHPTLRGRIFIVIS